MVNHERNDIITSMPFVWILRTLIADHGNYMKGDTQNINGYSDAKKAKLIFHSTRGISPLFFLSALRFR